MLSVLKTKKHSKVTFTAGHFYKFNYRAWENDPEPIVIFINAVSGINESTGNQHRYIQAINLNYVPRKDRKKFIEDYLESMKRTKSIKFTWKEIQKKYKYIGFAIRRYFYIPHSYIYNVSEIPFDIILSKSNSDSWAQDYSKQAQIALAQQWKRIKNGLGRTQSKKKK